MSEDSPKRKYTIKRPRVYPDKPPIPDKAWFEQLYLVEKRSIHYIGNLLNRSGKSVHNHLLKYGIPTRPRGRNFIGAQGDHYFADPTRAAIKRTPMSEEKKQEARERIHRIKPWTKVRHYFMQRFRLSPEEKEIQKAKKKELHRQWMNLYATLLRNCDFKCPECGETLNIHNMAILYDGPYSATDEERLDLKYYRTACRKHYDIN